MAGATKVLEDAAKEGKGKTNIPIDWDKIAVRFGIIISFLTIVGFLITLAFNIISLGEKVGILEGQMQMILQPKK